MLTGVLIAESLKPDANLDGLHLLVRKISRWVNEDPLPGQVRVWMIMEFETTDDPGQLAEQFANALGEPGWYVDFSSDTSTYVIFPDRVFVYPRGDQQGRAEATAYARSIGVPESQCDWGRVGLRTTERTCLTVF